MQANKPGKEINTSAPASGKDLLRNSEGNGQRGLLRSASGAVFTSKPKERKARHFAKAYAYRIYTSVGVTPFITLATLWAKKQYNLDNVEAAFLLGGMEFVVKPFTYALFEWGAAHVKWGYNKDGKAPANGSGEVFSKDPKEGKSRHFVKAYSYRVYTSVCVTPLITLGTLWARKHFGLDNGETAMWQGGMEFLVKPFTYAFFEYVASHVKPGYRNGVAVPLRTETPESGK